jgi:hypothetical protein
VIVDGMAPHVWLGPSAAKDWYRDVLVEGEHHGAVVLPATMRFSMKGAQVRQTGAHFTVALRRLTPGWRITAWAWTKGRQQR